MKKSDLITIIIVAAVICGFAFIPGAWDWFNTSTRNHGLLMSFFKFAILGTFGEMLALRIREGVYLKQGFGLVPKMLVWGFLGVVIASAMTIFKSGTINLLDGGFHLNGKAAEWFKADLCWGKVLVAFCISVLMNTLFAPVFMTFHKITDIHIAETGGTLRGFFSKPLQMGETLSKKINWDIQYGFVFAKTIPFFWYPAHTITFLLPGTLQVLFAALLGVALGVILSIKK
ncbi:MAG: hypothetical protein K6A28_00820 [Bacteroidales bacterium]|nr:hypothetical protein [Bacteroidales bacterium]